jgi:hypothetical protein
MVGVFIYYYSQLEDSHEDGKLRPLVIVRPGSRHQLQTFEESESARMQRRPLAPTDLETIVRAIELRPS